MSAANGAVRCCYRWSGRSRTRTEGSSRRGRIAIGLYIRLGILETPVFARVVAENRVARAPVAEVLRRHPREILLTALCRTATEQAPFYVFTAFVFA